MPHVPCPLPVRPRRDVRWAGIAASPAHPKGLPHGSTRRVRSELLRRARPRRHRRDRPGPRERDRRQAAGRRSRRGHEPHGLHAGRAAGRRGGGRVPGREEGGRTHRHDGPQGRAPPHGRARRVPLHSRRRTSPWPSAPTSPGRSAGASATNCRFPSTSTSTRRRPKQRRSLAAIRAGEYEGLAEKLARPAWAPDAGPARFNARSGATVVGAREFLLAYNVNLNTLDRRLANEIALEHPRGRAREARRARAKSSATPTARPSRCRAA